MAVAILDLRCVSNGESGLSISYWPACLASSRVRFKVTSRSVRFRVPAAAWFALGSLSCSCRRPASAARRSNGCLATRYSVAACADRAYTCGVVPRILALTIPYSRSHLVGARGRDSASSSQDCKLLAQAETLGMSSELRRASPFNTNRSFIALKSKVGQSSRPWRRPQSRAPPMQRIAIPIGHEAGRGQFLLPLFTTMHAFR